MNLGSCGFKSRSGYVSFWYKKLTSSTLYNYPKFQSDVLVTIYTSLSDILSENIGVIIPSCAFLFAIWAYQRNKKTKKLSYLIRTTKLIDNPDVGGLQLLYENTPIENLSLTNLLIVNEGNFIIENKDVPTGHDIQLEPINSKVKIYKQNVFYSTRDANKIQLSIKGESLKIGFDYLNENDGCVIRLLHSVDIASDVSFKLKGQIKGIDKIGKAKEPSLHLALFTLYAILISVAILLIAVTISVLVDFTFSFEKDIRQMIKVVSIFVFMAVTPRLNLITENKLLLLIRSRFQTEKRRLVAIYYDNNESN